jgi:DNA-binding XRE family transcriptional regulator
MSRINPRRDVREVMEEWFQPTAEERLGIEQGAAELQVSHLLYKLRKEAGLTQEQLAEKVGTARTAIARLEDASYQGHSLALLRRVAHALGKEVVIVMRDREPAEAEQKEEVAGVK